MCTIIYVRYGGCFRLLSEPAPGSLKWIRGGPGADVASAATVQIDS